MDKIKLKIGVVSDVVCPWCYIGKRKLEKAMKLSSDQFEFEVEYFPFELNPHLPEQGVARHDYLISRYGSEERYRQLTSHIVEAAAREGLIFRPDLQETAPNTRNAHRIILVARDEGKQSEVVEALFSAHFTKGVDLSNIENLVDIADRAGLDSEKIQLLLNSNTGKLEIEMAEKELQELGITSIPLFIIDDRTAIAGAQPVEVFMKAFGEAAMDGPTVSAVGARTVIPQQPAS